MLSTVGALTNSKDLSMVGAIVGLGGGLTGLSSGMSTAASAADAGTAAADAATSAADAGSTTSVLSDGAAPMSYGDASQLTMANATPSTAAQFAGTGVAAPPVAGAPSGLNLDTLGTQAGRAALESTPPPVSLADQISAARGVPSVTDVPNAMTGQYDWNQPAPATGQDFMSATNGGIQQPTQAQALSDIGKGMTGSDLTTWLQQNAGSSTVGDWLKKFQAAGGSVGDFVKNNKELVNMGGNVLNGMFGPQAQAANLAREKFARDNSLYDQARGRLNNVVSLKYLPGVPR